jgi:hypothetical protein
MSSMTDSVVRKSEPEEAEIVRAIRENLAPGDCTGSSVSDWNLVCSLLQDRFAEPLVAFLERLFPFFLKEDIEEIMQESFLGFLKKIRSDGFRSGAKISTLLFEIAKNKACDLQRWNSRRLPASRCSEEELYDRILDEIAGTPFKEPWRKLNTKMFDEHLDRMLAAMPEGALYRLVGEAIRDALPFYLSSKELCDDLEPRLGYRPSEDKVEAARSYFRKKAQPLRQLLSL